MVKNFYSSLQYFPNFQTTHQKMSQGKSKHHLTRILQQPHKDAFSGLDIPIIRTPKILKEPLFRIQNKSSVIYTTSTISGVGVSIDSTEVTGPKTYYVKPSGFDEDSLIGNATTVIASFASGTNFKPGEDSYMNLDKIRIITKIKVTCISNVNSHALNQVIQERKSKTDPPQHDSYQNQIPAFRLNPGGYQGFNIYKITNSQWQNRNGYSYFRDLKSNESLFKTGDFYHSENT